ncbi:MAG: DNA-binding response regulator [Adhaeribacter sp.]|nr:DNA-binding response regulator [Adhaeribacter sp.]
MKILIIEDEPSLGKSMVDFLKKESFVCELAFDFATAQEKINLYQYDCIVLDLSLPDGNGLELLRELKTNPHKSEGVVIISAKNSLDDKIAGLDLGADDYLTKPFHLSELNSRIKSVIRRRNFNGANQLVLNEIIVDFGKKIVLVDKQQVRLSKKEYQLLLFLIANRNRVVSKSAIAEHLSGDEADVFDDFDFIYAHIKNLKRKLTEGHCPDYIKTIYGLGYQFSTDETA